jgi:hypothetical protein
LVPFGGSHASVAGTASAPNIHRPANESLSTANGSSELLGTFFGGNGIALPKRELLMELSEKGGFDPTVQATLQLAIQGYTIQEGNYGK